MKKTIILLLTISTLVYGGAMCWEHKCLNGKPFEQCGVCNEGRGNGPTTHKYKYHPSCQESWHHFLTGFVLYLNPVGYHGYDCRESTQ